MLQNMPEPSLNIDFQNQIDRRFTSFLDTPSALAVKPEKFTIEYNGDGYKEMIHNIHNKYMKKIESKIPKQNQNLQQYHQHLDSLPLLILFGIGDAHYIEQLIELIDIKNIIIIDSDYSDFKYSMQFVNWERIINYFGRDGYSFDLKISQDTTSLSHLILNEIEENYLHYSSYIPYFISYENLLFLEVMKKVEEKYYLLFNGWGFYDDEKLGFENSLKNLKNNSKLVNITNPLEEKQSAFIIGSGPSLDGDIQYIKKHRQDVIIFSCGTALKVLEKHRIVPDFHIEIERTEFLTNVLKTTISEVFKKKIDFIGLNVIDSEVFNLFKSSNMFFKKVDASGTIIPHYIKRLDYIGPTVVNGAISIVSQLNFKDIYLFGTDMGYKDEKNHHSKDSAYNKKGTPVDYWKPTTHNITFPGNFDKNQKIYSISVYQNCKKNVEVCIRNYNQKLQKNISYFNCSDGAFIEGTTALKAENIHIEEDTTNQKSTTIENIKENFLDKDNKLNKDILNTLEKEYLLLLETINKIILEINNYKKNNNTNEYKIYFDFVNKVISYFPKIKQKENNTMYNSFLKGDINRIFLTTYSHSLMANDINDAFNYINHSLDTLSEFLLFVKIDIENIIKEPLNS